MIKKILLYILLPVVIPALGLYVALKLTTATVHEMPKLENGDIVFQTMNSPQAMAIMFASNTVYTHVGIVKVGDRGEVTIIQAMNPVKETPLNEWIEQGIAKRMTVKRLLNIDSDTAKNVVDIAYGYLNTPYDLHFLFDDDEMYCSELVYKVFKKAGIELGEIEIVKDLNIENFAVTKLIENRWEGNQGCVKTKAKSYEECYKLIMNQKVITPESIAHDEKLQTIYTNYGIAE